MNSEDTIAAIATAPGEAGISIVRVSGPDCYRIADDVFRCRGEKPSSRPPFTFVHGHVVDGEAVVDEALLLLMRAPRSYTGEDTVEIHGHGGVISAGRTLARVIAAGARIAEPGEFTKRAFLNGRLDLTQAEAVLDLIRAKSDRAAAAAIEQLSGSLAASINEVYDSLIGAAGDLESTLDFPEDELPQRITNEIAGRIDRAAREMDSLQSKMRSGHILREGALVVIVGRPNVGKSSLMNALLNTNRAIVSHIPGTTRDVIEEGMLIDGAYVRLVDTAGLRASPDEIEREGIRRAIEQAEKADFFIYMIDGSEPISDEDTAQIARLDAGKTILVVNKADLGICCGNTPPGVARVTTSIKSNTGVGELMQMLSARIRSESARSPDHRATISERHGALISKARHETSEALLLVGSGREENMPLAADRLRGALEPLGMITGRVYHDELLNNIFSRFCIGK